MCVRQGEKQNRGREREEGGVSMYLWARSDPCAHVGLLYFLIQHARTLEHLCELHCIRVLFPPIHRLFSGRCMPMQKVQLHIACDNRDIQEPR